MHHAHQWRATSKVFALVCECGLVYHEWLVAEVDRLKAPSSTSGDDVAVLRIQLDEALAEADKLRAQLGEVDQRAAENHRIHEKVIAESRERFEAVHAENSSLRAQLDEAKQQLEKQAQEVTNHVVASAAPTA